MHRSALFAAGLVLFVLTLLVNAVARLLVLEHPRDTNTAGPREAPEPTLRRWRTRRPAHEHAQRFYRLLARFAVSPARRRSDRIIRGTILSATVLALIPLVLIVYYLLRKGLGSWSLSFFTTDPTGSTFFGSSNIGGIKSAILGTIEIVALASAIAIPVGIGVAVWLVEYGRGSWFANTCASSSTCSPACRRSSSACSCTSCSSSAPAAPTPATRARSRSRC